MSSKITIRTGVLIILIILAALSRMIDHMNNFSPLGAIGLFGAAYFTRKWQAPLVSIFAIWLSDLFLNNIKYSQYNPGFTWFSPGFYWLCLPYVLIALFGVALLKKVSFPKLALGALGSSLIFFLVTNTAHWLFFRPGNAIYYPGSPVYPINLSGLLACYAAGIPFFKGTLLGDLFYVTVLFGSFALLKSKYALLNAAPEPSDTAYSG